MSLGLEYNRFTAKLFRHPDGKLLVTKHPIGDTEVMSVAVRVDSSDRTEFAMIWQFPISEDYLTEPEPAFLETTLKERAIRGTERYLAAQKRWRLEHGFDS